MSSELIKTCHGGRRGEFVKKYGLNSANVIDFSVNVNPLGPSAKAIKAIISSLDKVESYPDENIKDLQQALSAYIGVDKANIVTGNGSIELIYHIINVCRPKKVVVIAPTFTEYERAARLGGASVKNVFLTENYQNLVGIDPAPLSAADIIFICNPNNPTGTLHTTGKIKELRRLAPNAILIVDEAFMDFVGSQQDYSIVKQATSSSRLIVVRSLGKFFALAGLRLGYLVTNIEMAEFLTVRQIPWNINNLAIAAARAALDDGGYITNTNQAINRLRKKFYSRLNSLKMLKVYPSRANYFLVKIIQPELSAKTLQDKLAADNILIRTAADFKGLDGSYFRVAVRGEADNQLLADKLEEILI